MRVYLKLRSDLAMGTTENTQKFEYEKSTKESQGNADSRPETKTV